MGEEDDAFLADRVGIPVTNDLRRYLEVAFTHKAVKANSFNGIIERIHDKLTGWRAKYLSFAGRVVLDF